MTNYEKQIRTNELFEFTLSKEESSATVFFEEFQTIVAIYQYLEDTGLVKILLNIFFVLFCFLPNSRYCQRGNMSFQTMTYKISSKSVISDHQNKLNFLIALTNFFFFTFNHYG